ncbi:MAG: DUF6378 domain-containing protein [bacterium]|nr:DUF6378 domain-containing protein [bacterium]
MKSLSDRSQLLQDADELINGDRHQNYGDALDNFARIATLWSSYLGHDIKSHDVGVMMALLKISRISYDKTLKDSFVDALGYIALAGELAEDKIGE